MKKYILPCELLRPFIDRYWVWEGEYDLPKILPGTGHELVFHYASPYSCINKDTVLSLPNSYILTVRNFPQTIKPNGSLGFIAVRFRSGAFHYFCRPTMAELADKFVDIQHIWGKTSDEFTERVISASNFQNRIAIIESFLLKLLDSYAKPDVWLDKVIRDIYYNYDSVQLKRKCCEWGISNRQLQRKFKDAVGISPKSFQIVSRFQSVMRRLLLEKKSDYLDVILDNGYFDQSHFIKDFQRFTGEPPSSFLKEQNFMTHFYNRSFQTCSKI
jgi:AraC-like DNA-binding protein